MALPLAPALIAMIGGALITITRTIVGRVLLALGLSLITYTGVSTSIDYLKGQAVSAFTGMGSDVVGLLGVMKVGEFVSLIVSAIVARSIISGIQSDSMKRWVTK